AGCRRMTPLASCALRSYRTSRCPWRRANNRRAVIRHFGGVSADDAVEALLNVIADAKTKVYGDADPALTYQVSGLKNGDTAGAVLNGGGLVRGR
ncbi:MBG domain-containing protein, partial [Pseudomonas aeruginosa]|uniref:MBG domain-containing protein n=1 Tax=Pseudomonas aeruginosa TaxID=287 RepID=UPI0023667EB2